MSSAAALSSCGIETRRVRRWAIHPRSVGLARDELRVALVEWELTGIEDSAVLILSELVTNAVRHARVPGGHFDTSFCRSTGGVRLAVDDADERHPEARPQSEAGGRGLALIEALSDRWGVRTRRGVGKSVWAVVTVPGGRWF
ncbi:ATP-binding protein [Streptomyces ehimensis]|uniref:ATP-binding protein n=1 Tax=Streptomyces ehimensis TaxID=68195 RepID=A0ABV9BLD6_9ACTN